MPENIEETAVVEAPEAPAVEESKQESLLDRLNKKFGVSTPEPEPVPVSDSNESNGNEDEVKEEGSGSKPKLDVSFDDNPNPSELDEIKEMLKKLGATKQGEGSPESQPAPVESTPSAGGYGLEEEQEEEVEVYEFLESSDEKYAGIANKALTYFKEINDYASEKSSDPYWNPEEDEDFIALKKNKPKVPRKDYRRAEVAMLSDQLLTERETALKSELEKARTEIERLKSKPESEKVLKIFNDAFDNLPEDADQLQRDIYSDVKSDTLPYIETYLDLANGIVKPDPENKAHNMLGEFVGNMAHKFSNDPAYKDKRYRKEGGKMKVFVSPAEYSRMENRSDFWTFSNEDIVKMITEQSHNVAKDKWNAEVKRLEKLGWVKPKSTQARTESPTQDDSSEQVKGAQSPSPGATSGEGMKPTGGPNFLKNLPFVS
jgi:hypothetical protein